MDYENIFVGGIYRNEPVVQDIYAHIKQFFNDIPKQLSLNEIEFVAWTYAEFVKVLPFLSGNGRTSRLIMNYQLLSLGFPPVSISVTDRFKLINQQCFSNKNLLATLIRSY